MLNKTSDVVNGQLVAISPADAWRAIAWGPTPGQASGPAPVPSVPPLYSAQSFGPMSAMSGSSGQDQANVAAAAAAASAPFHGKLSPLPWAILFLVIGLIGMRLVHWR